MRFLAFLLLMALFSGGPTQAAASQPVLLYLFVQDGDAFTEQGRQMMEKYFAEVLPGHRMALVESRDGRLLSQEARVREELSRQLAKALKPGEVITHLVLATHGSTSFSETGSETELRSFGAFTEESTDKALLDLLKPIRGHLAKDANVILDACSTMCGTDAQARLRAQTFMKSLGVPDGILYGATQPEVDVHKLGPEARTWEKLKPRWNLVRQLALLSVLGTAPIAYLGLDGGLSANPTLSHLQMSVASTALLTLMFQYLEPLFIWFYERTQAINQGRIFVLQRGKVLRSEEISKRVWTLNRLYLSRSCGRVLGN